jgi:hypothetical protein
VLQLVADRDFAGRVEVGKGLSTQNNLIFGCVPKKTRPTYVFFVTVFTSDFGCEIVLLWADDCVKKGRGRNRCFSGSDGPLLKKRQQSAFSFLCCPRLRSLSAPPATKLGAMKLTCVLLLALATAAAAKGARGKKGGMGRRAYARRVPCVPAMFFCRPPPHLPLSHLPTSHLNTHKTEYTVDWKLPSLQSPPRDAFDPLTVAVGDTVVFEWKGGLAYMLYRVSKREWLESVFVRERGGRCMQRLVLTSILPCSPHHSRVPRVRGRL